MKKNLKPVDSQKNLGLSQLPTSVRNKMGYMKKGGMVKGYKKEWCSHYKNRSKTTQGIF